MQFKATDPKFQVKRQIIIHAKLRLGSVHHKLLQYYDESRFVSVFLCTNLTVCAMLDREREIPDLQVHRVIEKRHQQ